MANKWQSQLKDSFESYGEAAPEGLWEAVSAGVASVQAAARKRRRARIYGYSAAAFAAVAALAFFLFVPTEKAADELAPTLAQLLPEPAIQQPEPPSAPSLPQHSAPAEVRRPAPRAAADVFAAAAPAAAPQQEPQPSVSADASPAPETAPAQVPVADPQPSAPSESSPALEAQVDPFAALLAEDAPRRKRNKYSVSLLAANSRGAGPEQGNAHLSQSNSFLQSSTSSSKPISTLDNYHHYQPFVTGVTVSWQFLPRLSLDSGVNYSRLYSVRNPLYSDERDTDTMTLHYVGVPLGFRFNFLQTQRFNLYAAAGGTAQKLVSGTREVIRYSGSFRTLDYEDLREAQWQWSVDAGIGVSYRLLGSMSLYVQPGMSYHFDNGSELVNIYKRRPLNFSLSAGLRFDISR